ncbi:hypothetical protein BC830DRAFT_1113116 [Chytriomyces sp. MP71]|nr:hypothetical protein BC830DRAFT_1113116 [Chytriomyces sp. MP71]
MSWFFGAASAKPAAVPVITSTVLPKASEANAAPQKSALDLLAEFEATQTVKKPTRPPVLTPATAPAVIAPPPVVVSAEHAPASGDVKKTGKPSKKVARSSKSGAKPATIPTSATTPDLNPATLGSSVGAAPAYVLPTKKASSKKQKKVTAVEPPSRPAVPAAPAPAAQHPKESIPQKTKKLSSSKKIKVISDPVPIVETIQALAPTSLTAPQIADQPGLKPKKPKKGVIVAGASTPAASSPEAVPSVTIVTPPSPETIPIVESPALAVQKAKKSKSALKSGTFPAAAAPVNPVADATIESSANPAAAKAQAVRPPRAHPASIPVATPTQTPKKTLLAAPHSTLPIKLLSPIIENPLSPPAFAADEVSGDESESDESDEDESDEEAESVEEVINEVPVAVAVTVPVIGRVQASVSPHVDESSSEDEDDDTDDETSTAAPTAVVRKASVVDIELPDNKSQVEPTTTTTTTNARFEEDEEDDDDGEEDEVALVDAKVSATVFAPVAPVEIDEEVSDEDISEEDDDSVSEEEKFVASAPVLPVGIRTAPVIERRVIAPAPVDSEIEVSDEDSESGEDGSGEDEEVAAPAIAKHVTRAPVAKPIAKPVSTAPANPLKTATTVLKSLNSKLPEKAYVNGSVPKVVAKPVTTIPPVSLVQAVPVKGKPTDSDSGADEESDAEDSEGERESGEEYDQDSVVEDGPLLPDMEAIRNAVKGDYPYDLYVHPCF